VNVEKRPQFVHVVSHGPQCLDGVTAAVVITRYYRTATVLPHFSSNADINETLRAVVCEPRDAAHEVWITDISWTDPAVDRHLQTLLDRGVRVYWIDHHRTALERFREGAVHVRLTDCVLSEEFAAARLTYAYLQARLIADGAANDWFTAVQPLVALADDNDRWCHQIPGSRELALTVGAMHDLDAYHQLASIDATVRYTPRMQEAAKRVQTDLRRSVAVAERSRVVHRLSQDDLCLVTAVCDGYASEIADAWGRAWPNSVFALYDVRSLSVSLRRSPDCTVDLSRLARSLGGGGHPAAAGCELPDLRGTIAEALANVVAAAIKPER